MERKEELTERAQLVRTLDSLCHIQYPNPEELAFRVAVMKKLGLAFGLKEMRQMEIRAGTPMAKKG